MTNSPALARAAGARGILTDSPVLRRAQEVEMALFLGGVNDHVSAGELFEPQRSSVLGKQRVL